MTLVTGIALRLATGAGWGRLVRQLLTETMLLFALGAAAGLFVAYGAIEGLTGFFAIGRRPILLDVPYDWRLIVYALGVTFATGVLTGVWPAIRAVRLLAPSAWTRWLERVRGLPGVRSASLSVLTPLSGRNTGTTARAEVRLNHVSEDYFRTFGIEVLAGRPFTRQDAAGAIKVVVLNETATRSAFVDRSALGERVTLEGTDSYQVVGVVRDHKHLSVREPPQPMAFVPIWQPVTSISRLTLSVSSSVPGTPTARAIADDVRTLHPATLVSDVIAVDTQIDETLVGERLLSMLASGLALLVLALAAVGLYGIVSYAVAARTTEFGIRLALGASRARVVAGVIADAIMPVGAGIAIGLPLARLIARAAQRLLFGVTPVDATSHVLGAAAIVAVAVAAAWLPARRACGLDPAETLRRG
jgi:ABC-type antimicrobial peptide transport system permease subunit